MTGPSGSLHENGSPYDNWAQNGEVGISTDTLNGKPMRYTEGSSIGSGHFLVAHGRNIRVTDVLLSADWMYEEAVERAHKQRLRTQPGLRGVLTPFLETWRLWAVLILTGIFVGYTGGTLDVLVAW